MNRQCKCTSCNYVFDIEDAGGVRENHWLDGEYMGSETFLVCPNCGSDDYEDSVDCCECGEAFTEDEIYEGWCEKCLRETINYDTFFEYCEANISENYLDDFVMRDLLHTETPDHPSFEFHCLMIQVYSERVQAIKSDIGLFGKSHDEFLDACIRFIMDDDGSNGREDYADWLNKREVK